MRSNTWKRLPLVVRAATASAAGLLVAASTVLITAAATGLPAALH